jgi:hypothetical protein
MRTKGTMWAYWAIVHAIIYFLRVDNGDNDDLLGEVQTIIHFLSEDNWDYVDL